MLLEVGCRSVSSTETQASAIQRESGFEFRGRAQLSLRKQSRTSLRLPNEGWRTLYREAFYRAPLNQPGLFQSNRLLCFCCHNVQFNWFPPFYHSDSIEFSEEKKMPCSTNHPKHANGSFQVVPFIGRALLILGLGLGLSSPAMARMAASPVSTVSKGHNMLQSEKMTVKQEYVNDETMADISLGDRGDLRNFTSDAIDSASNNFNTVEISDDELRLSENFWKGIPTPKGSYLYNLKMQLGMYPRDSMALEALLRAVMEQRDMLRALTVLETLLYVQPNDLNWKFLKAQTHEYLGELSMAKLEYEELLSLQPLSARYMQGLAMLLNKQGEETKALELIQKTLDSAHLENKDVEARNLGVLFSQYHIQLGNFEKALQQLSSMIEQDPDDFRPYLCQGLAYTLMNQNDKATQNFKKYMQLCPPDAFDHSYLDSLMLKARSDKQTDTFMKASMKATSRNSKKAKPMKQPSFAKVVNPDEEDLVE